MKPRVSMLSARHSEDGALYDCLVVVLSNQRSRYKTSFCSGPPSTSNLTHSALQPSLYNERRTFQRPSPAHRKQVNTPELTSSHPHLHLDLRQASQPAAMEPIRVSTHQMQLRSSTRASATSIASSVAPGMPWNGKCHTLPKPRLLLTTTGHAMYNCLVM